MDSFWKFRKYIQKLLYNLSCDCKATPDGEAFLHLSIRSLKVTKNPEESILDAMRKSLVTADLDDIPQNYMSIL